MSDTKGTDVKVDEDPLARAQRAFAEGDYLTTRALAAPLASGSDTPEDKRLAAQTLLSRTSVDPRSRALFALAAGLMALLSAYWTYRAAQRPEIPSPPPPQVEFVK
jgi:hypothetical protein